MSLAFYQALSQRIIVDAVVKMSAALGVTVIAQGIETDAERAALRAIGVRYIQDSLFGPPAF